MLDILLLGQLIAKLDQFFDSRRRYGAIHSDADPLVFIHVIGWKETRFQAKRLYEERIALYIQDINDSVAGKPQVFLVDLHDQGVPLFIVLVPQYAVPVIPGIVRFGAKGFPLPMRKVLVVPCQVILNISEQCKL